MNLVETLQNLEPVFIEAGQLAYKMQKSVSHYNKRETGNPAGDIVTEADFAVQEFVLKEMVKTDLVSCRLLAEEDTISVKKFNDQGKYYLSIDPIDDTKIYASGKEHFSVIISLHNGEKFLYMFVYFPAWDWTHKIVNDQYAVSGKTPDLPDGIKNTILYWSGNPEEHIPKEILNDLKNKGIIFSKISDMQLEVGSIGMFASGMVAGVYHENMNSYDGFVEFNIALAKGLKTYSSSVDLRNIKERESGLYYPGYYLALC